MQLLFADISLPVCDLLDTGDIKPLPALENRHEITCLQKPVMRPRIEPSRTAAQKLYTQPPLPKIFRIYRRDLQLASGRRRYAFRNRNNVIILKIQPRYRIVRLRSRRLLLNRKHIPTLIKLHNSVILRVRHLIAEDKRAILQLRRLLQSL